MQEYKLLVDGMSCAACSAAVEKALRRVDGVENAQVNLATGTALIQFDETKADLSKLETAIKKQDSQAEYRTQMSNRRKRKKKQNLRFGVCFCSCRLRFR